MNYKLRSLGYVKPTDSEDVRLRRQSIPIYQLVANPRHCLKLSDLRKICFVLILDQLIESFS